MATVFEKEIERPSSPTSQSANEQVDTDTPQLEEVETTREDGTPYVTGWALISLMISITLGAFLMLLDVSILTTAIPMITSDFHSLNDIGWYGSAYQLACAALQPLSGKLYTYFKSKFLFLGFLFLFELGCLICGIAKSSTVLIVGRAIAGIGASGIQNGALTIIAASTPMHKRPVLIGVLMGFAMFGIVLGPLIGGALTEYSTWRWCFYINLPIGGVCLACIAFVQIPDVREKSDDSVLRIITTKLDLIGFAIFAPCTIMFLLALQWGGTEYAWKSATIIGLFCGGGVTLIVFILWERHVGDGAMIPLPVIRQREIWTSCVAGLSLFATVMLASYFLPIYFQSVKGETPFRSGVDLLPSILMQVVSAVINGVLIQKVGYYLPFIVIAAVFLTISNGLLTLFEPNTSVPVWAGYQILLGFGRGMAMQVPILAIQAYSAPNMVSIATASLVFCQTFGGAVTIAVANVIFNTGLRSELKSRIPEMDTDTIIDAGASAVRQVVPPEHLADALMAYSEAATSTFYFGVAASIVMFFAAWGTGWKDIRKKKPAGKASA